MVSTGFSYFVLGLLSLDPKPGSRDPGSKTWDHGPQIQFSGSQALGLGFHDLGPRSQDLGTQVPKPRYLMLFFIICIVFEVFDELNVILNQFHTILHGS